MPVELLDGCTNFIVAMATVGASDDHLNGLTVVNNDEVERRYPKIEGERCRSGAVRVYPIRSSE